MVTTGGLSPEEEAQLLALLGKVEQPFSRRFNEAIFTIVPCHPLELVIYRGRPEAYEVLLTRRTGEPEDPWNDNFNCPGTLLRVPDGSRVNALRRLLETEVGCDSTSLRLAYTHERPFGARALCLQEVYLATIPDGAMHNGTWYPVDNLPDAIIPEHIGMIRRALLHV